MKVAVWDTYVTRKDGKIMHFDILVDENTVDTEKIFEYGKTYLKSVAQEGQSIKNLNLIKHGNERKKILIKRFPPDFCKAKFCHAR